MKKILLGFIAIGLLTFVGCEKEEEGTNSSTDDDTTETSSDDGSTDSDTNSDDEGSNTDSEEEPIDTFQVRLDNGETPFEIYQGGVSVNDIYGKKYQGGLIVCLNTSDGSGVICSPHRESAETYYQAEFQCEYFNNDGYYDWEFPKKKEMTMLYENLHKKGLGNFRDIDYWFNGSSSFGNLMSFKDGSLSVGLTGMEYSFRHIRFFNN